MKRLLCASLLALFLHCSYVYSWDKSATDYLTSFMQNYQRPYTVFELYGAGNGSVAAPQLIRSEGNMSLVLLQMENVANEPFDTIGYDNVILLKPPHMTVKMLDNLAACEQPDVIIVHDIPDYCRPVLDDYIDQFLRLGDYCGIDFASIDHMVMQKYSADVRVVRVIHHDKDDGAFLFFKGNKQGLTKARWTSKIKQKDIHTIRYNVHSDFEHKTMIKQVDATTVESGWERGINLVTFVMLYGVYPTDSMIINKLKTFRRIKHNDFVMGNVLVQGRKLLPIDFNDKRRNIRVSVCLDALLKSFEHHELRMQSPEKFIDLYKKLVKRERR